jgi:transmembrane sensor
MRTRMDKDEENIRNTNNEHQLTDTAVMNEIDLLKQMEQVDSVRALSKVKDKINYQSSRRKWLIKLQKAAAILLIPLLSLAIWQSVKLNHFNQSIVQHNITTPPTLRSDFTLPDGTKVWLNGNTSLSYPTYFKGNERIVELNGEAYFDVAPNKSTPFIVKTEDILIEAVGTEFNCLTFKNAHTHQFLLTEGKVNILQENNKGKRSIITTLTPNKMAVYNKQTRKINVKKVDPLKYIAWKEGKIIFENDKLENILTILERWYNVEFVVHNDVSTDYAFTGSFEGEDLTQILSCIELTTPISFTSLEQKKSKDDTFNKKKIEIKNKH